MAMAATGIATAAIGSARAVMGKAKAATGVVPTGSIATGIAANLVPMKGSRDMAATYKMRAIIFDYFRYFHFTIFSI